MHNMKHIVSKQYKIYINSGTLYIVTKRSTNMFIQYSMSRLVRKPYKT